MNTRIAAASVSYVAAAITVAACSGTHDSGTDADTVSKGTISFAVTAVNAGANAKPRLAPHASPISSLAAAAHTIDPSTYPVQLSPSGPPDEMILTIRRISVDGPEGPQLLFGPGDPGDGSGPGVDIHLTNGAVDLAAAGLTLNSIRPGRYTRVDVSISRSVKMRGCVGGLFAAQAAVGGTYNGQTYTTDTLAAGTHEFCTIASKGLLNFLTSPAPVVVGSDADYEAQTTGELTEFDIGGGSPTTAGGSPPTTAQEVRDANIGIPMAATDFDVGADTPTKLTLVIDMNRMLRFWPNISTIFQPLRPQGLLPGTSYFFNLDFEQNVAIFAGDAGSIEGYQVTSEICVNDFLHPGSCGVGDPPNTVTKEWLTVVRDPSGTVLAGGIAADDAYAVIIGDVVPTGVVAGTIAGTFTLPIGLYRNNVETNGTIDGFRFQLLGDPEDSATVTPGPNAKGSVLGGGGPFPLWYTRRL